MKIAVDSRMLKMSGIGTYIQNLMRNDCYQIALGNKEDISEINKIDEDNIIEFESKIYGIKEQLKFPYKQLREMKPDILHVPHYNIPIFYRGKMVVTVHDLTHLIHKEFLPNKLAYYYAKFMIWLAIKKAKTVFTVSENTKKDILKYFKVHPDKIKVAPLAVGEEFIKKNIKDIEYLYEKFNIPRNKKILMYVGNLKPHKNLEKLIEAFSLIENKEDYRLLLVGKAFKSYNVLEDREKELKIDKYVINTGIVTQEELVDLYNLVDLFIFPSLYEGFGLPVLEALACGTKVICSNTSSIPEVGGEVVEYFDPYNVEEIKQKIDVALNKEFDSEKVNSWLENFSWKKTAVNHKNILENIYKNERT